MIIRRRLLGALAELRVHSQGVGLGFAGHWTHHVGVNTYNVYNML
jgi:hypothetical protein